jgi:NADP-dependent 3-hydroxy acid dehydrogenase YdfG
MTHTNVAIVTGGSAGIGAEICRSMLDAGYEVISMAFTTPASSGPTCCRRSRRKNCTA